MSHSDIKDILEINTPSRDEFITKQQLFGIKKSKPAKKVDGVQKRPDGMTREVWSLRTSDNSNESSILTGLNCGYKQTKARIGLSRVRQWEWASFVNPAREDGAEFKHWRRKQDKDTEYAFASFNKKIEILNYTDEEYKEHLQTLNDGMAKSCDPWTRGGTDDLMRLAVRFDARFPVIKDRWDEATYGRRTIEQLKQRYYDIFNTLTRLRYPADHPKVKNIREYDGDHERKRKLQLDKIMARTTEEIEEEVYLSAELRKIEVRKREREKKTRDLQRLISAADGTDGSCLTSTGTTKKSSDRGRKSSTNAGAHAASVASSNLTSTANSNSSAHHRQSSTSSASSAAVAGGGGGGQRGRPSASSIAAAAAAAAAASAAASTTSTSVKGSTPAILPPGAPAPTTPGAGVAGAGEVKFAVPAPIMRKLSTPKVSLAVETQRMNKKRNGRYKLKQRKNVKKSPMTLSKMNASSLTLVKNKKSLIGIDAEGIIANTEKYAIKGIQHAEIRQSGISLMSHKLKLPTNIGVKKIKDIEHSLSKLEIPLKPMSTEDVIEVYNEVRSDVVIVQQLSNLLASAEFDLESSKQKFLTGKPSMSLKRKTTTNQNSAVKKPRMDPKLCKIEYNKKRCELLGIPPCSKKKKKKASQ